ncbi:hypothetical protein H0H93_012333, partial [Arthromyces matolae]
HALSGDVIDATKKLIEAKPAEMTKTHSFDARLGTVEDLQRSNWRPNALQAAQLEEELAIRNSELLQMDYDILRIQLDVDKAHVALKALIRDRLEKQKAADECQAWLSSARLLPLDALTKIFEYAKSERLDSKVSILTLSHVCSSWRNASLTCRSLWNDLVFDAWNPKRSPTLASFLDFWHGRSNHSLPLHLSLSVTTSLDQSTDETITQDLIEHASRLEVLRLSISSSRHEGLNANEVLAPFFALPAGSCPALHELHLVDHTPLQPDTLSEFPLITAFNNSPQLKKVVLNLDRLIVSGVDGLLPWSQLTYLAIGGTITVAAFVRVFFDSTQLTYAAFYHVSVLTAHQTLAIPADPVIFPYLRIQSGPAESTYPKLEILCPIKRCYGVRNGLTIRISLGLGHGY